MSKLPRIARKMQLTVRETTVGGRDALVSEIKEKAANAQVEVKTNKVQMMISDLDDEATRNSFFFHLLISFGYEFHRLQIKSYAPTFPVIFGNKF